MNETISINEIIRLYTIFSVISLPITLSTVIIMYFRRVKILLDIEKIIDSKLKTEPFIKAEKAGKGNTTPVPEEKGQKPAQRERTNSEMRGTILSMSVGDRYMCCLSADDKKILTSNHTWSLDNPFVGQISSEGLFEAKKYGTTNILCGPDGGKLNIYRVNITSKEDEWFAKDPIENLITRKHVNDVMVKSKNCKIIHIDNKNNTQKIQYNNFTCIYCTNDNQQIIKLALLLKNTKENREELFKHISDYFETIKTEKRNSGEVSRKNETSYWYHETKIEGGSRIIDLTGFIKSFPDGNIAVGLSECWRPEASIEEISQNTDIIETSLRRVLDAKYIPETIGEGHKNISVTAKPIQEKVTLKKEDAAKAPEKKNTQRNAEKQTPQQNTAQDATLFDNTDQGKENDINIPEENQEGLEMTENN